MLKSPRSTCLLWICCLLLGFGQWSLAQSSRSIVEVFKSLEQKHEVVFSYNPRLIQALQLSLDNTNVSLDASLKAIGDQLPLSFERVGSNGILVIPVRANLEFSARDIDDQRPIDLVYVALNNETPTYLLPQNGRYTLKNTFITDSITINTSFYHTVKTTIGKLQSEGSVVEMKAETTDLGDVTILSYITTGVNSVLGDHRIEVDMSDLGLIAGETDGDVYQVLQAVPGIRSPNGKPGSLNLRGGPFDQNLTLFDNIPIYHTGHFFGTFSPYNPGIVDKISVYRSGLPASWGGRVGGVIDIKTQQHVPDSASFGVMMNTVTSGLEVRLPIVKNKLGLIFSSRANIFGNMPPKLEAYYDLNFQGSRISSIGLNGPVDLRNLNIGFSDINGKLIYKPGRRHHLSLSFLNIGNDFSYELFSRNQNRLETETSELDNWGLTLEWQAQLSDAVNLRTRYTSSQFRLEEQRTEPRNNGNGVNRQFVKNGIDDQRLDVALNVEIDQKTDLNAGYEFSNHDITFDDAIDGDNPQVVDMRSGNGDINALYFSLKHQFSDRLIVDAGLRYNQFSVGDQSFIAPKLFLTYLATKSLFFKGSATGSYQYVRQNFADDFDDFRIENQFWLLVDGNIPVLRGKQYMVGGLLDHGSWLFDIELYDKDVDNVIRPNTDQNNNNEPPNLIGDLNVKGIDFLAKKRWKGFESWISYSLSKAEERFRVDQPQGPDRFVTREAFYDQRHVLNLKAIVPLNRWSLAASWSLMSGVPVYEADRDEILDNNSNQYDIEYTGNFPAQHQLDLSASYVFSKPTAGWRGVLGFSILNVYDRRNIINAFQEAVNINNTIRYGLGLSPNIQLKVTF